MKTLYAAVILLVCSISSSTFAQVGFLGAKVLTQRTSTQGARSIEDANGNLYMAIPFNDTLKLKNPDTTLAAPSHRGQTVGNYALAIIKTNKAGDRKKILVLASSYNREIGAYWQKTTSGKLKLVFNAAGGLSVGRQRAPHGPTPKLASSAGFVDLDTNLIVSRIWQTEREIADSTYRNVLHSTLAGPNRSLQYVASEGYTDTTYVGRDLIDIRRYKSRGLNDYAYYAYLAAINNQQTSGQLAVKHVFWQPGSSAYTRVSGLVTDSVGNVYMSLIFQKAAALMMDDTILHSIPINTPLAEALGIFKFSPTGRLIWFRPFINNYLVHYQTMRPTPNGDRLYLALEARGEIVLADSLVQTDFTNQGCAGVPGNSLAVVLDQQGRIAKYSMFNNEPSNTLYRAYINSIELSPMGEVFWAGVASGFPKIFGQGPIQVWQTLFVTSTDANLGFRWRQLVGGPSDGTSRSIHSLTFNPVRQELMFVGFLSNYVSRTAVGVGSTVLNTVCPAQFIAKVGGLMFTSTKTVAKGGGLVLYPNPSQAGQMVTVLSEDRSYRLVDVHGRTTQVIADQSHHTARLPQVAPGVYQLIGDQSGKSVRVVLEQ